MIEKLNKTNTLVNVSNSILKFYGLKTFHSSNSKLDEILNKNKDKKLAIILLDGFGKNILNKYKDDCPFLYNHIFTEISSVYPPTTVAATSALLTGKYPVENGFLGWNQNFKNINRYLNVFSSFDPFKDEIVLPHCIDTYLKPNYIINLINDHYKRIIANELKSFNFKNDKNENDLNLFFSASNESIKLHSFSYLYCGEPDHLMHSEGTNTLKVKEMIQFLNLKIEELVKNNPDTLFIVLADHGFIDIKNIYLNHEKELLETLKDPLEIFSVEGRFASFEVKEDKKEDFLKIVKEKYSPYFEILTKEEIINEEVFGYGKKHPFFDSFLGDYFLLAKKEYNFANDDDFKLIGAHAGIIKEEMEINLMIFND